MFLPLLTEFLHSDAMEQALLESKADRPSFLCVPPDQRRHSPAFPLDRAHGAAGLQRRRLLPLPDLQRRQSLRSIAEVFHEPGSGSRSLKQREREREKESEGERREMGRDQC